MTDNIGQLDQQITIERPTRVSDGAGGFTETWAALETVWADVFPEGGTERNEDGAFNATGTFRFVIRFIDGLTERDRILWGGEYYNIRQVARRGGREMYLNLRAERGAVSR